MKILILLGPFSSFSEKSYGGVEKLWLTMGKKFKEYGNDVTFISKKFKHNSESKIKNGILFNRIRGYSSPKNKFLRLILDLIYTIKAALILSKGTDIIVTNSFWSPIIFPFFISKKSKIYVDVARMPKGQMFLYRFASRLRVNTKIVKYNIIKEVSGKIIKKIKIIPPSLPFESPDNINFLKKKSLIVYLGRIHEEKGIELFIDALQHVNLNKWKVRIIGPWKISDGGSGLNYKNFLLKKIPNKSVSIENPISSKKIFELYKETSIFVYPSLAKDETFGLSVAEFMSYGAAPIVSSLSCFKDYIKNNINGMRFNHKSKNSSLLFARCLKTLINNKKIRFKISKNAFEINKTHSVDIIAKRFLTDFHLLIKPKVNKE
jgi:glycosyltransferase involved in cell wall biosynthesis|tara:strand:- start:5707 stop:6834 length:1128 start_codon:yes stop_codon:yes gene_type:complete